MIRLSPTEIAWLREAFPRYALTDLGEAFAARFGRRYAPSTLKRAAGLLGIRSGRPKGSRPGVLTVWTPEQIAFVRAWRPYETLADLTRRLNRHFGTHYSVSAVGGTCMRNRIAAGSDGGFPPGNEPWNKGLKGFQAGGRAPLHQFQPGQMPQTWVPIGTRVRCSDGYWKEKVADSPGPGLSRRGWRECHRLVWEAAHGPQPRGTAIIFIDGDLDNLTVDNLACVTRAELARLNQLGWRYLASAEARRLMIDQVKLTTQAHRRAREAGLSLPERRRIIPRQHKHRPDGPARAVDGGAPAEGQHA